MSPVALGSQPSAQPLPTGVTVRTFAAPATATGPWPASLNYLHADASVPFLVGPLSRPTRFWWVVAATVMTICQGTAWQRYDYLLRLVDGGGNPVNDLNGRSTVQKADSTEQNWRSVSISNYYYCEANTTYNVQLLSASSSPNVTYHKDRVFVRMWSHTIGEGAY